MELGAFSISLAVKDIEASRRFYEKFGFNFHRRPRSAASAEDTRGAVATTGGREHNGAGQLRRWTLMETRFSSISMCEQDGFGREIGRVTSGGGNPGRTRRCT